MPQTSEHKRVYLKQWREKNKDYRAAYHRKYKFGISPEQYEAMLAAQNFKCAICHTDAPGRNKDWSVDHCHIKGDVRGLLCNSCNVGLGHFRDNTDILSNAIAYLNRD